MRKYARNCYLEMKIYNGVGNGRAISQTYKAREELFPYKRPRTTSSLEQEKVTREENSRRFCKAVSTTAGETYSIVEILITVYQSNTDLMFFALCGSN